jgi:shikimate kinase
MKSCSKIYLIGFMGSGKSTVGKKLASSLKWSFIDLDERIEIVSGMKIASIFSEKGESHFRSLESTVLKSLKNEDNTIISTGGGTPCFNDNMDFMTGTGLTIYLKMTPAQLKVRLSRSAHERPLIKNIGKFELEGFIENKLNEREKWYSRSDVTFIRFNGDFSDLYSLIKSKIRECN